jgi:Sulfotransferase family
MEQYKLVFFWIPKVGSTAWKALFMKMLNIRDWRTRNGHDRHVNGITYSYLNHFNQSYIETMLNDPCWTRAAIIRDPKDRIVSAWLDRIVKGGGKMLRSCCRRTPQEQEQAELELQASMAAADPLIDPQFLVKKRKRQYWDEACVQKGVATLGGFVQRVAEWCPDTHWNAQSKLIGKKFTSTLNFVGHLDTIADDAKALLQRIGAWEEHGVTGWGQYGNESIFATKSGVQHKTSNTTARQEDPYDRLTKYYTPDVETMVEKLYKSDYATREFQLKLRKINFTKNDDPS